MRWIDYANTKVSIAFHVETLPVSGLFGLEQLYILLIHNPFASRVALNFCDCTSF